jgi:hypothetical protein
MSDPRARSSRTGIKEMVQIFGMTAKEGRKTPSEYWDYVRERDRRKKQP